MLMGAAPASAGGAPDVRVVTVARLNQPVGFTFTPAGRIVYLERATGQMRILDPRSGRDRLWHRITGVDSEGERGALGVALHPRWPRMRFAYVFVSRTPRDGALRNQVLRLRIRGGRSVDRAVLLNSPIGGRANHNGGRIAFGPDGKLYVVIGDGGEDPGTAQTLVGEPRGKILRMNPDGSVPASNPFGSRVWSYGHRNSIGFAFDPMLGELWQTENGPECNDELNHIVAGGNFAWGPTQSCGTPPMPGDTNQDGPDPRLLPEHTFADTVAMRARPTVRRRARRGMRQRGLQDLRGPGHVRPARARAQRARGLAAADAAHELRWCGVLDGSRTRRPHLLQQRHGHLSAGPRLTRAARGRRRRPCTAPRPTP
jgi:glucose/arabinose dehydrogenase